MDGLRFVAGEPDRFASSPGVTRTFCGRRGTSLTLHSEAFASEITVSATALDDPEALPPEVLNLDVGKVGSARDGGRYAARPALPRRRGVRLRPKGRAWP